MSMTTREELTDKVVLTYGSSCIYESDVSLLPPGGWLNDAIISLALEFIEDEHREKAEEVLLVQPCTVALCFQLAPDELSEALESLRLSSRRIVCLPINDGAESLQAPRSGDKARGKHWSLLAFDRGGEMGSSADVSSPCFVHFDSMPGSRNEGVAREVAEKFWPVFCDSDSLVMPRFERGICSPQINGFDCGVHTLLVARHIAERSKAVAVDLRDVTKPTEAEAERRRLLATVRSEEARGVAR
jgi:Ulp1 family protease